MKTKLIAMTMISIFSLTSYAASLDGYVNRDLLHNNKKVAAAKDKLDTFLKKINIDSQISKCNTTHGSNGTCELAIAMRIAGYEPPTKETEQLADVMKDCVNDTLKKVEQGEIELVNSSGEVLKENDEYMEMAAMNICIKKNPKTADKLTKFSAGKEQKYINNAYALNLIEISCKKGNRLGCIGKDNTSKTIKQLESELLKK